MPQPPSTTTSTMSLDDLERCFDVVGPDVAALILGAHEAMCDLAAWKRRVAALNLELRDSTMVNEGDGRGYQLLERGGVAVGVRFMHVRTPGGEWGLRDFIFTPLVPGEAVEHVHHPARDHAQTLCIYEMRHGADMTQRWA